MNTPVLTVQVLRLIAEKVDALTKANVDVSEFRLDSHITVRVSRHVGMDQRDGDTYHVTQILVREGGKLIPIIANGSLNYR